MCGDHYKTRPGLKYHIGHSHKDKDGNPVAFKDVARTPNDPPSSFGGPRSFGGFGGMGGEGPTFSQGRDFSQRPSFLVNIIFTLLWQIYNFYPDHFLFPPSKSLPGIFGHFQNFPIIFRLQYKFPMACVKKSCVY